jgi:hypothetical protein
MAAFTAEMARSVAEVASLQARADAHAGDLETIREDLANAQNTKDGEVDMLKVGNQLHCLLGGFHFMLSDLVFHR